MSLRFGINLLWVRPEGVGGTEFFVRHLLAGMRELPEEDFEATLITSRDNAESFKDAVARDSRLKMLTLPVDSRNILHRIIWQNFHMNKALRKAGITNCFTPVYDRPVFNGGIRYVAVIHDIQAYHFPQYHPLHEVVYSKWLWRVNRKRSVYNVAISEFVRKDIEAVYHFPQDRLTVIYDPVSVEPLQGGFETVAERYHVQKGEYYYTVGQLIPHKNMETLLKIIHEIREQKIADLPAKLLISGINGNAAAAIRKKMEAYNLGDSVVLTGFVSAEERNQLYANAKAFLFPSVFEGFGVPPIEAMMYGTRVVATRCACIPEVTQELATYVNDPYDAQEWIEKMRMEENRAAELDAAPYDKVHAAKQYLDLLRKVFGE